MAFPRFGGSFAPPLPDAKLAEYEQLAASAPPQVTDYMRQLIAMMRKFRETPESTRPGTPHPVSGLGLMIVPLEAKEVERIWDHVPWPQECDVMGSVFEAIDNATHKPLRDAAFHLLWFARELCADREPITNDKIKRE